MIIDLFINGKKIQAETAPDQMLIDFLRGLGYKSMKRGCDTGNCGLCTGGWMRNQFFPAVCQRQGLQDIRLRH